MQIITTTLLWAITAITTLGITACGSSPPAASATNQVDMHDPKYTTIYDAFSRYDTNSDSLLDKYEFTQFQLDPAVIAFRAKIPEAQRTIPLLFEEIDENGDERLSLEEITIIAEGSFQKMNNH